MRIDHDLILKRAFPIPEERERFYKKIPEIEWILQLLCEEILHQSTNIENRLENRLIDLERKISEHPVSQCQLDPNELLPAKDDGTAERLVREQKPTEGN